MKRAHATILLGTAAISAALAAGCASSAPQANVLWAYRDRPTPNLALADVPDHNLFAAEFAGRAAWPTVDAGYQVEDVAYYSNFTYDDQSFYDRYSGGFSRQSVTSRSGVIVR